MTIPLIPADDVRAGRNKSKSEKYTKYAAAIAGKLSWIKDQISDSDSGTIYVRSDDMKKELGEDFTKLADSSFYWGIRYVLFQEGIFVEQKTHKKDESKLLLIRLANEADELPSSLRKYLEPSEDTATETVGQQLT